MPTVLKKEEVFKVIQCMSGTPQLMAKLLYGSGLRVSDWQVPDLVLKPGA